jgi:hypothetical protein
MGYMPPRAYLNNQPGGGIEWGGYLMRLVTDHLGLQFWIFKSAYHAFIDENKIRRDKPSVSSVYFEMEYLKDKMAQFGQPHFQWNVGRCIIEYNGVMTYVNTPRPSTGSAEEVDYFTPPEDRLVKKNYSRWAMGPIYEALGYALEQISIDMKVEV